VEGALGFSIVSGWFPFVLFWLTVVVCVVAVVMRRGVLMEFAIGIPLGIILIVGLFVGLHFGEPVPPGAPRSLYLWLGAACLIAGLVIAGWHTAHWPRRIFGLFAIVLAVVSAGSSVNQTFDYYPTLDRLLGKQAAHFLSNAQLDAMRAEVKRTGKLPTHGATLSVPIPPTKSGFRARPAYVWVPPEWFAPNRPQLPVIELLGGTPGQPSDWTRAAYADTTSLAFAEMHGGVAPILVMPDINGSFAADTECVNSHMYGAVETYLTQDVPAFMQKSFNAKTTPGSMAVAGLSEGGTCALMLALTNPKLFPTFASYSGFTGISYQFDNAQQTTQILFGGSQAAYQAHDAQFLLTHQRFEGMAGWFESGAQDALSLQADQTLSSLASRAGIETCVATPPGTHSFAFWKQAFADSLPWLSWRLHLTPEPTTLVAHCVSGSA
jgi:S-formylglutathione hydrolase FrmB